MSMSVSMCLCSCGDQLPLCPWYLRAHCKHGSLRTGLHKPRESTWAKLTAELKQLPQPKTARRMYIHMHVHVCVFIVKLGMLFIEQMKLQPFRKKITANLNRHWSLKCLNYNQKCYQQQIARNTNDYWFISWRTKFPTSDPVFATWTVSWLAERCHLVV